MTCGVPSALVPTARYGTASITPVPSGCRWRRSWSTTSRPGTANSVNGKPPASSVIGMGPVHSTPPASSRIATSGAGPKPFWWNV